MINSVQVCVFVLNHGPKQDVLKLSNMGGGGGETTLYDQIKNYMS